MCTMTIVTRMQCLGYTSCSLQCTVFSDASGRAFIVKCSDRQMLAPLHMFSRRCVGGSTMTFESRSGDVMG